MKKNATCYIFLLSKAYQKGHRLVQKRLQPYGLTNLQYLVLEVLWHREGSKASDIGEQLNIDKATLSGIIDRMQEGGWLAKEQDPNDMRVFRLFPSQKANDLRDRLVREREAANEELLAPFSTEEKILLKRFLVDMV